MAQLMRRRAILAKIETTYGVDAAPTGAVNAILVRSVTLTPLAGDDIERALIRPYFGSSPMIAGEKHAELEIEVELAGAGAAGTAPKWSPLLRACGFAETLVAATSAAYNPITGSEESLTLYVHRDGILHKLTGARGTVSFMLDVNSIPVMKFKFLGLLGTITDAALPVVTVSGFIAPLPVTSANTSGFALHGYAGSFSSLSLDMAVSPTKHMVVGPSTSILVTDRKPSGSVTIEEPSLAAKDFYTASRDASLGAFALQHGTTAGNIITFAAPAVSLGSPTEQDTNGIQMMTIPLNINPVSGNDELILTVK